MRGGPPVGPLLAAAGGGDDTAQHARIAGLQLLASQFVAWVCGRFGESSPKPSRTEPNPLVGGGRTTACQWSGFVTTAGGVSTARSGTASW